MNYENVVLIFKNRFPIGNTYSFIAVHESNPIQSPLQINGITRKLDIIAFDITQKWNGTKTEWIRREVDHESTLFNKSWDYLYRLDDGKYGIVNFSTGKIQAFDNVDAESIIHRFFFDAMSL
jgi:hypothetical protein